MKFIDWREDFDACVVVKGMWWWKRYAVVEWIHDPTALGRTWRFVENQEDVDYFLKTQLHEARSEEVEADRLRKIPSPWKQHRIANAAVVHRKLKHSGSD